MCRYIRKRRGKGVGIVIGGTSIATVIAVRIIIPGLSWGVVMGC